MIPAASRPIFTVVAASLTLASTSNAAPRLEDTALLALRAQDRRVLAIGWRLTESMAELCANARPGLGWLLHDLDQYRPALRNDVEAAFGLGAGELGVLALAPDAPAARAGVREGDVVLMYGALKLERSGAVSPSADHASLARDLWSIEQQTSSGPISVRVRRGSQSVDLVLQPALHCPWPVQVEISPRLSAAADGVRVSVSSALADFASRDDDLAFIIAHEMAHNLRRPDETGVGRGSRPREVEADRIGLILAARAGYDTAGAGTFMTAIGRRAGSRLQWFSGHPPIAERAATLNRLHLWIEAERRAGRPLRP